MTKQQDELEKKERILEYILNTLQDYVISEMKRSLEKGYGPDTVKLDIKEYKEAVDVVMEKLSNDNQI